MNPAYLSPLANHLWQSTLFAAVAGLLTLALGNNRAGVRHWVWLAASWKFLIPFSVLIYFGSHIQWPAAPEATPSNLSMVMNEVSQPFTAQPTPSAAIPAAALSASVIPTVLLAIWACGFLWISYSWCVRWWHIRAAVRAGSPVHRELPIRTVSSPAMLEPGIFGVFRPILVLPEGICDRLPAEQLNGIIAHELCHVYRRDNLIAMIHMFVETVFWFHPLVWWVGRRMVAERERACDEEVLRLGSEPRVYAEGILNVCKLCIEPPLACMSGITGSNLKQRIAEIMAPRKDRALGHGKRVLLAALGAAAVTIPIATGILCAPRSRAQTQSAEHPEFEVASVHPFKAGSAPENRKIIIAHRTLTIRQQTLRQCIAWAYGLNNAGDMTGVPGWVDSQEYDITAKAAESTPPERLRLMLQTLLAERFKLRLHSKLEQRSVYALIVGKSGPKLQEVDKEPVPGVHVGRSEGGVMNVEIVNTIPGLIAFLRTFMDLPVLDKTGLAGVYQINLRLETEDTETQLPQPGRLRELMKNGIFAAVEQLGLKLTPEKGPMPVLVIDHIEKASAN